jgi:phenylacetic acid degradation operon negative regulatory protein
VQTHVASWSELESRCVAWRGEWIGVHTAGLERSRSAHPRRRRALSFLGFEQLAPGLWVRPNNLSLGVAGVRERLVQLGLDPEAPVFSMAELGPTFGARAHALWDTKALARAHDEMREKLGKSGERLLALPLESALVECFELGGRAIRLLAFDPLLPEPIAEPGARRALLDEMRRYDRSGRRIWRKFMHAEGAPALESLLDFRAVEEAA